MRIPLQGHGPAGPCPTIHGAGADRGIGAKATLNSDGTSRALDWRAAPLFGPSEEELEQRRLSKNEAAKRRRERIAKGYIPTLPSRAGASAGGGALVGYHGRVLEGACLAGGMGAPWGGDPELIDFPLIANLPEKTAYAAPPPPPDADERGLTALVSDSPLGEDWPGASRSEIHILDHNGLTWMRSQSALGGVGSFRSLFVRRVLEDELRLQGVSYPARRPGRYERSRSGRL